MNKIITIYELLGLIKDTPNYELYVKYINNISNKEEIMWACEENIFDKLDNKVIFLNDKVEILEEDKPIIEKITINENHTIEFPNGKWTARNMDIAFAVKINEIIDYINRKEGN